MKEEYQKQFRVIKRNEKKRIVQEDNLFDSAKNITEFNEQTIEYKYYQYSYIFLDIFMWNPTN